MLQNRNIFDKSVWDHGDLLWMLIDRDFYQNLINVLRTRKMFIQEVWAYGLYHRDLPAIKELLKIIDQRPLTKV